MQKATVRIGLGFRATSNIFNHLSEAIRRAFRFNQRSIDDDDEWVDDSLGSQGLGIGASEEED
jgi:hypothetical protein